MTETENNVQGQKPKLSKLALVSVGLAAYSLMGAFFILPMWTTLPLVSLALGIIAIRKIYKSNQRLSGLGLAISGVLISAGCIVFIFVGLTIFSINFTRSENIYDCGLHLGIIGKAMRAYSGNNYAKYPVADRWCDLLIQQTDISEEYFKCPGNRKKRSSYAMNPNCRPNSPNDVALLFETKGSWNQFGGVELLTFENHRGEGCNILFNDGKRAFIKPEDVNGLKWGD